MKLHGLTYTPNQKIKMINTVKHLMVLLLICFFCGSCAAPEVGINEDTVYDRPLQRVEFEYELGPGDILEIVYHYTPKPETNDYYLGVGDVVKVEFAFHQSQNRKLTVTPDGNIMMPLIGDVKAIGLTPFQLQKRLIDLYKTEFIDPIITITMLEYNRAIDHLKKAITTSARGQSKLTTIRPDGYVSFPVIDDVLAEGKTIPELKAIVSNEYKKHVDNLTVTLILKIMNANYVFVMGEVAKPDYYLMERPYSVSQILSRAGGVLDSAEKSTILVISRNKERKPWGRLVDLEKILYYGDLSRDIVLRQYDIVFVPKSTIARSNLLVDQFLNRMIPPNLLGPYNIGGTLIDNRPLIR